MIILIVLAGLCIGTLLNLLVARLPRERGFTGWPRCTRCGAPLQLWQVLPVVGWLAQRGRARCCGKPLPTVFLLVEVGYALVLTLCYLRYGVSSTFFYLAFVAAVLVVTGAIDWLHRYIYTLFILGPALLALAAPLLVPEHKFLNALVGALIAGIAFAILYGLALFLFPGRSAPFGLGDVYLAIFIGAAIGFTNLMPALFYGMLLAGVFSAALLILRRSGRPGVPEYISYGSFLCIGALGYIAAFGLGGS